MDGEITISASVVAWYAAIVATASLGVSAFLAFRDRARIVVKGSLNYKVTTTAGGYDPSKLYMIVTVANRGRRPVTIEKVFLQMKEKPHSILADSLSRGPSEISEGKSVTFLCEQLGSELDRVKKIVAIDQTGRHWNGDLKND